MEYYQKLGKVAQVLSKELKLLKFLANVKSYNCTNYFRSILKF